MNNQRSSGDQIIRFLLLSFAAVLLYQHFFGPKPQQDPTEKREVPALAEAFGGIDSGSPLGKIAATEEIKQLNAELEKNDADEYSGWARLRKGLLQQYILQDAGESKKTYQELVKHNGKSAVDAQALYQRGDMLWRESTSEPGQKASPEALNMLNQMLQRGRGSKDFWENKIFVARGLSETDPVTAIPPRFEEISVGELKGAQSAGEQGAVDPQGILYRVDQYHRNHDPYFFYRAFDTVVRWFGNQPNYSYGLAIIFFAMFTRLVLQPLTKKQYESMKGMQVVAPEMKKIQEKYKGKTDQAAQQQMYKEIRAVYQDHGVSPMLGCGLALIQMPIFFFVVLPLIQHFEARMELVGASFLWVDSLAHPDIPLLIVYGISMFFSFRLSSTPPTDDQQRMMQMMMSFVFPVVFPFFLINYPSAFTMYWMTFNVVATIFQWRMLKAADPSKNIVKALMGTSTVAGVDPTDSPDALPPRPKDGKKKSRTITVSANGQENKVKSLLNGSVDGEEEGADESDVVAVGAGAPGQDEESDLKSDKTKSGRSSSRRSRRRRRH